MSIRENTGAGYNLYLEKDNVPMVAEQQVERPSDRDRRPLIHPIEDGGEVEASFSQADARVVLAALERAVGLLEGQVQAERRQTTWKKPLIPLWLTKYLLLITFIIQAFAVGMLEVFYVIGELKNVSTTDHNVSNFAKAIVYTGDAIMVLVETIQLIVIIIISLKLVKQVFHHTVSGSFLAQSYLSTVLLFAGLYTLFFRLDNEGWDNVVITGDATPHPIIVFLRLLYFSVSTATLCGTSSVEPLVWYCYLTVGVQMLLSFCYFASILTLTIVPRKQSKFAPPSKNLSLTQKIRQCCSKCWTRYQ